MNLLSDQDLLLIWESTREKNLVEKSLALLSWAFPGNSIKYFATLPIGQRDAFLLQLREKLFGPVLFNTDRCPKCQQKIEWEMKVNELLIQHAENPAMKEGVEIKYQSAWFQFRLPNSEDMRLLSTASNEEEAISTIIQRCLIQPNGPSEKDVQFPPPVLEEIAEQFSKRDPQADIILQLQCPECQHMWENTFDILPYLWAEIQEKVRKILNEIVWLARAFGWNEKEILEISPFRRQTYLQMIGV